MTTGSKTESSLYQCKFPYEGRELVEVTAVMQKINQLNKWMDVFNKKKEYWEIKETFETRSGNMGFILCREITEEESSEVTKGGLKIINDALTTIDHVRGSVHPKEKRC